MASSSTGQPTYSAKRLQWLEALSGGDRHAIIRQLTMMSWETASYRVINEARRFAPTDDDGSLRINPLTHGLINRGYFISQIAAIRRLGDANLIEGKKGVFSMTALLNDIIANRELITRWAIFDAEDLRYEYEDIKERAHKFRLDHIQAGGGPTNMPANLVWSRYELRHKRFDRLAGVDSDHRQPSDMIQVDVLENLKHKVTNNCDEIASQATKYIAHAATPESRAVVGADDIGLSLNDLWIAHQHLCEVAGFLSIYVLGDACPGFLATPQFDQFRYLTTPLASDDNLNELRQLWQEIDDECHQWSQWNLDAYDLEFG